MISGISETEKKSLGVQHFNYIQAFSTQSSNILASPLLQDTLNLLACHGQTLTYRCS